MIFALLAGGRVGISSAPAASPGAHVADANRPAVSELLQHFRDRNFEFARINLPAWS